MLSFLRRQVRHRADVEKAAPASSNNAQHIAPVKPASSQIIQPTNSGASGTTLQGPLAQRLQSFFGSDVDLALSESQHPALRNSWRNMVISFFTFVVFVYCFAIQIWVIARSLQASQASPSSTSPRDIQPSETQSKSTARSSETNMATRTYSSIGGRPTSPTAESIWTRAIGPEKAVEDLSELCLYKEGSEVSKRGDLAVALNILYNVWVAFFIILLLSYERKRLRFSRKAHSAAVVGLIQAWLAVDYLAKGVEVWLILAAGGVFAASFFNLLYGLPETHTHRRKLLPYLLSRPYDPSIPTAGKSYAVPAREGSFLPLAKDAVDALNRGIEEEQRQLKASETSIAKLKISKANFPPVDLVPYQTLPQTVLNPSLLKGLSEAEKKKLGVISKELEKSVIGGIMPFHSISENYNAMEMLRGMLRPSAEGAGASKEDPTDKLVRWKMMNDLLKDAGAFNTNPTTRPATAAVGVQPSMMAMPIPPPAVYAPYAPEANKMERYLQKQQRDLMTMPSNAYSTFR